MKKAALFLVAILFFPCLAHSAENWTVVNKYGLHVYTDLQALAQYLKLANQATVLEGKVDFTKPEGKKVADLVEQFSLNGKKEVLAPESTFEIIDSFDKKIETAKGPLVWKVMRISSIETGLYGFVIIAKNPEKDFSKSVPGGQSINVEYKVISDNTYGVTFTVFYQLQWYKEVGDMERYSDLLDNGMKSSKVTSLPVNTEVTIRRIEPKWGMGLIRIDKNFFWVRIDSLAKK